VLAPSFEFTGVPWLEQRDRQNMATNEAKKSGGIQKSGGAADLVIDAPQQAPEGYERSVRGTGFIGYWRGEPGDVLSAILRGPAPEKVQEKSKSKHGVALVELLHECIVTQGAAQLAGQDMARWIPGPDNQNGGAVFLTKAKAGEVVCVSIREGIKDEMMLAEGTKVWLKVGKKRMIPGTDHAMYDYEKYTGAEKKSGNKGGDSLPFDN